MLNRTSILTVAFGVLMGSASAPAAIISVTDTQPLVDFPGSGTCVNLPAELPFALFDFKGQMKLKSITSIELTMTAFDGDTGVGDFDRGQLSLGLNNIATGITLNGFRDNTEETLTFTLRNTDPNWLSNQNVQTLLNAVNNGQVFGKILDASPDDNCVTLRSRFDARLKITGEMMGTTPIPEPASMAVWSTLLAGAAIRYRRRRATNASAIA